MNAAGAYTLTGAGIEKLGAGESATVTFDVQVIDDSGSGDATSVAQTITLTIDGSNNTPVITSATTASFAENATGTVYTAIAADADDADATLTYALAGTDAALFDINENSGAVTFKSSPDFETAGDAGANNVYDITITSSDSTSTSDQSVAITVTDVDEIAVIDTSIVVFDLVNGVSSNHSERTFKVDVAYTIYVVVEANAKTLITQEGPAWGKWAGADNLDDKDRLVMVSGDGADILGKYWQQVTQIGTESQYDVYGSEYGKAVRVQITGNFTRYRGYDISDLSTANVWTGLWYHPELVYDPDGLLPGSNNINIMATQGLTSVL
jgi:VCBS repeat-containing protein